MTTRPALFASAYHPHIGGVEELVRQLAAEQHRRSMSPTVVTMRWPKSLPAREVHDGTEVLRHVFRVPEPHWRHLGGWALRSAATRRSLNRQLRERGIDLIHVQCVSGNARYALGAAQALKLPLVVTMQGELTMDATGIYQRSAQMRRTWRRAVERAQAITACSQFVLDEAEAHYGRSFGERGVVIPNGIRLADFDAPIDPSLKRPYVLGIGRIVPQKGFDVLIDAFAQVGENHPHVDLVLAGDGPLRVQLESKAATGPLRGRVHFLGSVAHDQAVSLFRAATAFVLASRHEPQGIVVLEAMAARTVVIAARVGGVPEMVKHGKNGLLFSRGSTTDLAEQLDAVLRDDSLRRRLVEAGRATAEGHDWSTVSYAYCETYARAAVLARGGG